MNKIPTAKALFNKMLGENDECTSTEMMIDFAKLHVEAALKQASEDGKIELSKDWIRKEETIRPGSLIAPITIKINKDSILQAYPLTNIK